jgi:uncharacterized protein (DUF305 family)
MRRNLSSLAALTLLAGPACAQSMSMSPSPTSPADKSFAAGMTQMNASMSAAPMTGNADQDFAAMMIPHHQGAIAMAQTELKFGKDPTMRRLAKDIIAAQNSEIALMHNWQNTHPAQ